MSQSRARLTQLVCAIVDAFVVCCAHTLGGVAAHVVFCVHMLRRRSRPCFVNAFSGRAARSFRPRVFSMRATGASSGSPLSLVSAAWLFTRAHIGNAVSAAVRLLRLVACLQIESQTRALSWLLQASVW